MSSWRRFWRTLSVIGVLPAALAVTVSVVLWWQVRRVESVKVGAMSPEPTGPCAGCHDSMSVVPDGREPADIYVRFDPRKRRAPRGVFVDPSRYGMPRLAK